MKAKLRQRMIEIAQEGIMEQYVRSSCWEPMWSSPLWTPNVTSLYPPALPVNPTNTSQTTHKGAYESTTFARRCPWIAWHVYCACLSGHLPASSQSRRRWWERFAGVLETTGREVIFQSFLSILQVFRPDNSSITLATCSLHICLILCLF